METLFTLWGYDVSWIDIGMTISFMLGAIALFFKWKTNHYSLPPNENDDKAEFCYKWYVIIMTPLAIIGGIALIVTEINLWRMFGPSRDSFSFAVGMTMGLALIAYGIYLVKQLLLIIAHS